MSDEEGERKTEATGEWTALKLGGDVVQMLLPHRRPFLFVDTTLAVSFGARPSLRAQKMVSVNEPVFDGHFPGLSLWPGVYTVEGLGQTTNLMDVMVALADGLAREGGSAADLIEALRAIDARARPGGRASRAARAAEARLAGALGEPRSRIGLAGAIDVKLIEPVVAGSVLEYRVTRTHVLANATRYDVEASVEGRPVARGTIASARP